MVGAWPGGNGLDGCERVGLVVLVEEKSWERKKPDWYPKDSKVCLILSTK